MLELPSSLLINFLGGFALNQNTSLIQAARVRDFLSPMLEARVSSVTPISAAKLYADLVMKPNRVKGRPPSVATHRAYLSLAKSLFYWGVMKGIVTISQFASAMAVGKPNAGKTQLRIEEARRFVRAAHTFGPSSRLGAKKRTSLSHLGLDSHVVIKSC